MKIQLREGFGLDDTKPSKDSLILDIYREMLLKNDAPDVDDMVTAYMAIVETEDSTSTVRAYIISFMLQNRNYCFMFGNKSCDCQELLIQELLEDEYMLLGE